MSIIGTNPANASCGQRVLRRYSRAYERPAGIKYAVVYRTLGHINVLCGRNNSGKTSIMEGLATSGKYALGKLVDDAKWLLELCQPLIGQFSDPAPQTSEQWFKELVESVASRSPIWYLDENEINSTIEEFKAEQRKYRFLSRFGTIGYDYRRIFSDFFHKIASWYKPVYIPPKRSLDTVVNISLNDNTYGSGQGIVNRLFYLKNQDLKSQDFKAYEKIDDHFERITDHRFNVFPTKNNTLGLFFQGRRLDWLPANDCGLGLSDILIILTIVIDSDSTFFCIEEPENHLHAQYQRKLMGFMQSEKSKQFCLSTHSSVFLDPGNVDRLFHVSFEGEVRVNDHTSKAKIIDSLGYSVADNLVADFLILCEGPTDVPILQRVLDWLGLAGMYSIKFWPLGGDIMASLDLSVFKERKNVAAIIDKDTKSSTVRTRFKRNCAENQIPCWQLNRYSIENYFTLSAIKAVIGDDLPASLIELDPNVSVDEQIGYAIKEKSIKGKNGMIFSKMTLADIDGTDLYEILCSMQKMINEIGTRDIAEKP